MSVRAAKLRSIQILSAKCLQGVEIGNRALANIGRPYLDVQDRFLQSELHLTESALAQRSQRSPAAAVESSHNLLTDPRERWQILPTQYQRPGGSPGFHQTS